ncbi:MAG: FHA domain-containing protein [Chloroflexota bacterium]
MQILIETHFSWLPWRSQQPRLAIQIVDALRSQVFNDSDEEQPLPNILILAMHPAHAAAWNNNPEWMTWLGKVLNETTLESGTRFTAAPVIQVMADERLGTAELRVTAAFQNTELGSTAALILPGEKDLPDASTSRAYLIVNGNQFFSLDQPVINLGRRSDNHLIIEDLRVSRTHAQIRRFKNQTILFDLNSTGGTFVNGTRITQMTLLPGDVISLAGFTLIYGEDAGREDSRNSTSPAEPSV